MLWIKQTEFQELFWVQFSLMTIKLKSFQVFKHPQTKPFVNAYEVRADWFVIEWSMCIFLFKANTAKQSHRAVGGQAGGQTDSWRPRPLCPKQDRTKHKGGGERQHQQYYDWLWRVSICSEKVVAWLSIAFFCSLVLIKGRGGGDWKRMRENFINRSALTNQHKKLQNKYNLIGLRRGRKFLTYKKTKWWTEGTNWWQKNWTNT